MEYFKPKPLTVKMVKPLFTKVISIYYDSYHIDLSYMKIAISEVPLSTNGKPSTYVTPEQFGGCHLHNKTIVYNKYFEKSVMYYCHKCDKDTYITALKQVTAHELAHEIWFRHADDHFKNKIIDEAISNDFQTVYTKSLNQNSSKYKEELFCEYLVNTIDKDLQFIIVDL